MWWEGCFVTAHWKWDFRLPTDPRQTRSWLGEERGASLPLGAGGNLGLPFFSDTTLPRGSGRLETWLRKGWWIWKRKLSTWSLLMGVELHYFLRCFARASVYCILFLPGCPFLGPSAREICLFVFLFCFVLWAYLFSLCPFAVSVLRASPASSPGCVRQNESPGNSLPCCPSDPSVHSQSASSLPSSESSYTCFVQTVKGLGRTSREEWDVCLLHLDLSWKT